MTDPSASPDEQQHTLPSGLTVTIRSHRTLRREHIHQVWAAGNTAPPGLDAAAQHDKLMELLVTSSSDPERFPVPFTTGLADPDGNYTPGVLDRLDGADYTALYRLMANGWRLANGLSVAPNPDEWADPTRPKPESNGSNPGSADTPSKDSPGATGTTSTTTSTSTELEDGPPAS